MRKKGRNYGAGLRMEGDEKMAFTRGASDKKEHSRSRKKGKQVEKD